jgi:hypothetical protein
MYIARQKLHENIAEYLLYMWQVEDIIRAFNFSLEDIEFSVIRPHYDDDNKIVEIKAWYADLIRKMKSDKVEKKGHLYELQEIVTELFYLHNTLLSVTKDEKYIHLYEEARENMDEFRERSNSKNMNEVELCLHALYSKLLLRLRKVEISKETEAAFESFRKLIAYLTVSYHQMKNGNMNFQMN